MSFRELLAKLFEPFGRLSEDQLDALERHYDLLMLWNRKLNLTRITDLDEVIRLHYGESLFLGSVLPAGPLRIADVGSGAGFPGFPIAVLRPECEVDLIESHKRKAVFLPEASRGVGNVRVIDDRAERVERRYDWVVSRAVRHDALVDLGLAPNLAVLSSDGGGDCCIPVPFNPGHLIQMFHVKHDKI